MTQQYLILALIVRQCPILKKIKGKHKGEVDMPEERYQGARQTTCSKGHVYDPTVHDSCPYCKKH